MSFGSSRNTRSTPSTERSAHAVLSAAITGAMAMYFLDPERGARRRRELREGIARLSRNVAGLLRGTARHTAERARHVAVEHGATFVWTDLEGELVAEQVRSEICRVVSHPDAIDVATSGGLVTLSGVVLLSEEDTLIDAVVRVPGVTAMENLLDVHDAPAQTIPLVLQEQARA